MSRTGAVIVAAGLSSRMGKFKPMLPIGNQTMISRVVDCMKKVGASPIVVVTGYQREMIEGQLAEEDVVFVHNSLFRETQMMDSLLLGLEVLKESCSRVLVIPGDIPLIAMETIQSMLEIEGAFVRPVFHGKAGHPVLLQTELTSILENYHGPGGLRGAIEHSGLEIQEVKVDDPAILMDNDTPEDYAKSLAYWQESKRV